MFNPLTPSEMVLAVGRVLKDAADEGPVDEWRRSQLLSAYSIARHLAAEQEAAVELRAWFRVNAVGLIREAELPGPLGEQLERQASTLESSETNPAIGTAMRATMSALREDDSPEAAELATRLRAVLRELCDREVAALARASA